VYFLVTLETEAYSFDLANACLFVFVFVLVSTCIFLFSGWLSLFFLDTIVLLSTERNSSGELVLVFDLSVHIPLFSISCQ
jgi:hypothetical protein